MTTAMDLNKAADLRRMPKRAVAGVGRVLLWEGGSLWIGHSAGPVKAHAHHAIQISLALTGHVRFRAGIRSAWHDYQAALVMPHELHEFDGNGHAVAQLFVEPETIQGRSLLARWKGRQVVELDGTVPRKVRHSLHQDYVRKASDESLIATARDAVLQLSGADPLLQVDPRITKAIEWMHPRLGSALSLSQVARVAHLSASRFRHLFVAQTGISFRGYLLWVRVRSAVAAAMKGTSWTEAAQTWGFADSAHLTRTCRRMFGIAPSSLVRED